MLKALSTRLLQHLISQNSWANAMLQPFAGKSVQFKIASLGTSLVILENGSLAIAGETNTPDATVAMSLNLALRLMAKDESAKIQISIVGDTHLAAELAKVFANMRWDYEDDLSKLVGDIPANKIGTLSRDAAKSVKETGINLAEMLSEYWQEENPMIAKKRHVEAFMTQVDTLRADVNRFEKRLIKLTQTLTKNQKTDLNSNAVDSTQ
jgi:ubiquinone biosynthesis accessory factor UbiJ